ncbi:mitochondrial import inner membrane translocase subunit TIM50 [Plasmodium brasilianum]|uniref:Mitochondrial import inner membrane translocase subunit TIM50 n=2 Tax=Plasmodium (Plasmodium) TaxID=418103 RepID=A0A1A8VR05_PLAMA|nr:mitochondrial import inner membrane translocase subunit TIM50, putative [Plasmodium malariae]KAI4840968.1 mitochondrial import inner membrane translocase subunit TIM50 [Plasmodium brasilianum]SBS81746.1 mitochondrial import inner membrane translocase subunit TIM50, putative [Plasmodium malariae]SBT87169.1 mitochondrial import inner membrane translocase subunit TIM50, putative [Plasmodium malariae]
MVVFLSLKNLWINEKVLIPYMNRINSANKVSISSIVHNRTTVNLNNLNNVVALMYSYKNGCTKSGRRYHMCKSYNNLADILLNTNYNRMHSKRMQARERSMLGVNCVYRVNNVNKEYKIKGKMKYGDSLTSYLFDSNQIKRNVFINSSNIYRIGNCYSRGFSANSKNMNEAAAAEKLAEQESAVEELGAKAVNMSSGTNTSRSGNNVSKESTPLNREGKKKTLKELYIDKKEKERMIKMYLLLSLLLMPFGYTYMYCIQNDISVNELIKILKKKAEVLENKYNDTLHEFIDKYFPLSNEPLLPDFKDLNYPENLPTLVIDLNYVIAKLEYDRKTGWRVLKRPYADLFFKELSSFYEIVIWSDDNFPVAQEVISKWGIPAIGCLHRDQCSKKKKYYVKDLKRLGRNLNRVVIIDHDVHAFMLQPENGILIKEFHGDVNDKEILCLIDLLKSFAISTYDISQFLRKYGGGDYNIGKRYLQLKSDTEQKSQRIRNIGKIFHLDNKKTPNGISFNS